MRSLAVDGAPVRSAGQERVAAWVDRHRRLVTWVYGTAAALLVPWIVALAIIWPREAVAHRVRGLAIASMVITAVVLLVAAWTSRRRRLLASMAATSACTLALISGWFHLVTLQLGDDPVRSALAGTVVLVGVGVGVWAVLALRRDAPDRVVRSGLVVAAILCVLPVGRALVVVPAVASADHLKTAWVGLDLAELTGLIATTIAVSRQRAWLVIAGAVTGTLLLFDAVVNVASATGAAQISALVMWLAELPLGVGALLLAWSAADRPATDRSARQVIAGVAPGQGRKSASG